MHRYAFEIVDVSRDSHFYRDAISAHAANGWKLVQILIEAPAVYPTEYVLVLEKRVDDDKATLTT